MKPGLTRGLLFATPIAIAMWLIAIALFLGCMALVEHVT